jgi:hypothetical protein
MPNPKTVGELFDKEGYTSALNDEIYKNQPDRSLKKSQRDGQIKCIRDCPLDSECGEIILELCDHARAMRKIVRDTLGHGEEYSEILDIVAKTATVIILG